MQTFKEFLTEGDVVDFSAKKSEKELKTFHSGFASKNKERAEEMAKLVQSHIDSGKFSMKVGDRFTTEHSRKNNLPPHEIKGYYVDPKNPEERYGYHTQQGDQPIQRIMIKDPKLEKIHGPEKWKSIQQGIRPFNKLQTVKK